jgi:uracil-DNA glycosylase family 4
LLDRVLTSLDMLGDCFISNAVKCRPPDNRDPTDYEIEVCHHFLLSELEIVRPSVIIMLGAIARRAFGWNKRAPRGVVMLRGNLKFVYAYHPAYCLRSGTAGEKVLTRQLKVAKGAVP